MTEDVGVVLIFATMMQVLPHVQVGGMGPPTWVLLTTLVTVFFLCL